MKPLPAPASRLWEASIRKRQTIRRVGSVAPTAAATADASASSSSSSIDAAVLPSLLSVSSSASNTIYQYHNEDDEDSDWCATFLSKVRRLW
ncbi:hypothetical protein U9M48_039083 [Paspalum notatum var. saurae]|uniref:Uncharacterized protein n=1 Tax=Paspalum notatum var. saurae TaxID=547442 RepID=A0AAQ3XCB3_PASNO